MPTTLEMPSNEIDQREADQPTNPDAEAAVELIDQGERESEPTAEPVAFNGKPKRGRKKKESASEVEQQPENELDLDHPFDTNAPTGEAPADTAPTPIDQPHPPKPPTETTEGEGYISKIITSRATRLFQISQIQAEYVETCLQMAECEARIDREKDDLKHLQKRFAELSIELRSAKNDPEFQPRLPMGDGDDKQPSGTQASGESHECQTPAESPQGDARPAAVAPVADNWYSRILRKTSINQLGLSPKLEEKLVDAGCINIGLLEELRAEISQGRAKWPKGVGTARITEIENAVVEWLSKYRDAAMFAELTTVTHDSIPTAEQWEDMTDDQQRDYIARRADAVNDGSPNCLQSKHPDSKTFWEKGYDDFRQLIDDRNCELRDCIYFPGIEMDEWIRGWLWAGEMESCDPTADPADESPISLDDI